MVPLPGNREAVKTRENSGYDFANSMNGLKKCHSHPISSSPPRINSNITGRRTNFGDHSGSREKEQRWHNPISRNHIEQRFNDNKRWSNNGCTLNSDQIVAQLAKINARLGSLVSSLQEGVTALKNQNPMIDYRPATKLPSPELPTSPPHSVKPPGLPTIPSPPPNLPTPEPPQPPALPDPVKGEATGDKSSVVEDSDASPGDENPRSEHILGAVQLARLSPEIQSRMVICSQIVVTMLPLNTRIEDLKEFKTAKPDVQFKDLIRYSSEGLESDSSSLFALTKKLPPKLLEKKTRVDPRENIIRRPLLEINLPLDTGATSLHRKFLHAPCFSHPRPPERVQKHY